VSQSATQTQKGEQIFDMKGNTTQEKKRRERQTYAGCNCFFIHFV